MSIASIRRVTGTLQAIEIIRDTFPISCDTCSLKTFNKSGVLVGPAGLEPFQAAVFQVWVKVWGSRSKSFPDVLDFAQVATLRLVQNHDEFTA